MADEEYMFEIKDGKEHDLLDTLFNEHCHSFIEKYLKPDMSVLDIGCGAGHMSDWLSQRTANVLGIDNNEVQIKRANELYATPGKMEFKVHSAYELSKLNKQFDLIYCRFTLHHLKNAPSVIQEIYKVLKPGGIYIGIEGIVNYAYSFPSHPGWQSPNASPEDEINKQIGQELVYHCKQQGFKILGAHNYQPVTHDQKLKQELVHSHEGGKDFMIKNNLCSEAEWQKQYEHIKACAADDTVTIGFFGCGLVAAQK